MGANIGSKDSNLNGTSSEGLADLIVLRLKPPTAPCIAYIPSNGALK